MKKIFFLMAILTVGIGLFSITRAATTNVNIEVIAGPVTIDSSGTVDIGMITSSPTEINVSFSSNTFRLMDMRGGPGYYTTIQFGNLIKGADRIANTNIQLKTLPSPNTIAGSNAGHIRFGSGIGNQFGYSDRPMSYFVRNPGQGIGLVGKYGDTPDIKITVPASQPSGVYRGMVYYTLYDME